MKLYFLVKFSETFSISEQAIIDKFCKQYQQDRIQGIYKIKDFVVYQASNGTKAGVLIPDRVIKNLLINEIKQINDTMAKNPALKEWCEQIKQRLLNENLNYITHSDL